MEEGEAIDEVESCAGWVASLIGRKYVVQRTWDRDGTYIGYYEISGVGFSANLGIEGLREDLCVGCEFVGILKIIKLAHCLNRRETLWIHISDIEE